MRPRLAISILAASALVGQATFEINGVLLDKTTNQGIAGASVLVQLNNADPKLPPIYQHVSTNVAGAFRFPTDRDGQYLVSVSEVPGYQRLSTAVTVSASNPNAAVRLLLERLSVVRGRVVDAETDEPVRGLQLGVLSLRYREGSARPDAPGSPVTTDDEGRFERSDLSTDRYAARIIPRLRSGNARHLTEFSEQDLQQFDEDYEESYWPVGGGLETAVFQATVPGVPTDFGTLRARKTTYYRARVRLAPGSCQDKDAFQAVLFRGSGPDLTEDSRFNMLCGQDLLLRGLAGRTSYQLKLVDMGKSVEQNLYLTLPFRVADGNLDLTAAPGPGSDLEGRVVLAEGARSRPEQMRVSLLDPRRVWDSRNVPVDGEGRFRFVNAPMGESLVAVLPQLMPGYVVSEVRFAGAALAGNPLRKFEWTSRGSLEVVIDDRPAVVTGTVTDGVNRPFVLLLPWPRPASQDFAQDAVVAVADAEGKFQASVPAGEYRVMAIPGFSLPSGGLDRLQEPGVVDRLVTRAEKVVLLRGGSASFVLPLLDPGR